SEILEMRILPQVTAPAQYLGGELHSISKDWSDSGAKMVFAFPDLYEIGMSHLGLRLLYEAINNHSPHLCERVFMPQEDMCAALRRFALPLYSLESHHELKDFDVIGFTLQYELSFSNILAMLDLAGIPLTTAEREDSAPLIVAGGPCAYNPEPLAEIVDVFFIGEGEDLDREFLDLVAEVKAAGGGRSEILRRAVQIPGVYVPSFYQAEYDSRGRFSRLLVRPEAPAETPETIKKRIVSHFDQVEFPEKPIMPWITPVHDRIMLEVMRGCSHGCRFCQAGMIYRPIREKSVETLLAQARAQAKNSGYDDMALLSLSTADYSCVEGLMGRLLEEHAPQSVGISLPSLRVDAFSVNLAARTQEVRKSGITLAPEAGSQRMRDVINKGVTEEQILSAAAAAFSQGYTRVKLYFMIGLPFESDSDLKGIAELCQKILRLGKEHKPAEIKKPIQLSLGVSSFVPKCDTPFQWQPQDAPEELKRKQELLREYIKPMRSVSISYHDRDSSRLEAVFARGDRRLNQVLLKAYRSGCRMDGWKEYFRPDLWEQAFAECGFSPAEYAQRSMVYGEALPWGHVLCGVDPEWLWKENIRAGRAELTGDCRREECNNCGLCDSAWQNSLQPRDKALPPQPQKRKLPPAACKYRCRLSVHSPAAWLSHLDLLGAVEKTLRRSGLPMAYSQGFNPHMLISWGPAHPVGLYSDSEYVDLLLHRECTEDIPTAFNAFAPPGLRMLECRQVPLEEEALMSVLNYAEYRAFSLQELGEETDLRIQELLAMESLPVERYSSKGKKRVDLRPSLVELRREGNALFFAVRMDRGAAAKPGEICRLLLGEQAVSCCRSALYIAGEKEKRLP
ncbi:MAG: TIGR03960 family B12-binding radical SAM protein, partial [Bacillota bacterium]|nr:TIGR03960 family B12-binding radical SAM protein [Bacillota bacterium]